MSTTELQGATALTFNNGELIPTTAFLQFVELAKAVEEAKKQIYATMDRHNVKSIKGTTFSITTGELKNWKASDTLPDDFYVTKLDTTKLNYMYKHGDTFPDTVDFTVTKYHRMALK